MNAFTTPSKRLLIGGMLAAGALIAGTPAQAATGTTAVNITLNPIVILHYFSTVTVNISGSALVAHMFPTLGPNDAVDEGESSQSASSMTVNLGISPDNPTGSITALPLVLTDAWAVRSINTGTNNTQLAITVPGATLTHSGTVVMTIGAAKVDAANSGGGAATINFTPPGLANPEVGSIVLPLDLTNATLSGPYTGGQVRLEATSL